MAEDRENEYAAIARRVARVRKIYSEIGEPLPAEIIIDLYRHLRKLRACRAARRPGKGLRH